MTAELDELKKILDSKTPLRHGGGASGTNTGYGYDASPGGGGRTSSYVTMGGGERIPHLDVNSIMKRFNSAGPSSGVGGLGSPAGVPAFGLGSGGVSTPAEEIASQLKSYDDAVAGAEVRDVPLPRREKRKIFVCSVAHFARHFFFFSFGAKSTPTKQYRSSSLRIRIIIIIIIPPLRVRCRAFNVGEKKNSRDEAKEPRL